MGSMMGISAFKYKSDFKKMTTEFNRAQAKDRKAERESEDAGDRLRALLAGEDVEQVASNSALAPRMREWVPWIRNTFAPYVIRRTLDSKDSQGNKIFGLLPYQDHTLLLELRDWEKKRLMAITDEIIDQGQLTTLAGAGKVRTSSYNLGRPGRLRSHPFILAELLYRVSSESTPPAYESAQWRRFLGETIVP
jgi:hypothetical protein